MRLVIDTNRIIAALIKDSATRRIILLSRIRFITIGLSIKEITKHKEEILEKADINESEMYRILSLLFEKIEIIDDIVIGSKMVEAKKIMDKIDKDDTKFIALALAVENDGIWSDDKHFTMQRVIKTWKTGDMLKLLDE